MISKEIQNCTYFRIVNDLLFCDIGGVCYMNWQKTEIAEDTIMFCNDGKVFYYEKHCLYEVMSNGTIKEAFKYEPSSYIESIENCYLIFNRISRYDKNYRLVDKEKNIVWLDNKNWGYKIIENSLFLFEENKISKITIQTGKPLWLHTLPEGFTIRGSVQAIDNVLFFIAYKDNHYQLVTGLDIETGNVLYQNQYEVTTANNFIVARNLNPSDNLMYGYGHVYQVLNPKTGEIILQKTFVENQKYDLLPGVQSIYDNKLWFVSRRGEKAKFGAVNLKTSEIDFIQDFPLENDGQLDKPVFHNEKLYLRDTNDILYVLE